MLSTTYIIEAFFFLNLKISFEIRSITNTLLRSGWYTCYVKIPKNTLILGQAQKKKRNITNLLS